MRLQKVAACDESSVRILGDGYSLGHLWESDDDIRFEIVRENHAPRGTYEGAVLVDTSTPSGKRVQAFSFSVSAHADGGVTALPKRFMLGPLAIGECRSLLIHIRANAGEALVAEPLPTTSDSDGLIVERVNASEYRIKASVECREFGMATGHFAVQCTFPTGRKELVSIPWSYYGTQGK